MNILFIYVPAAFTTEFQLQLVTRSCFSGAFLYQQFKQKYYFNFLSFFSRCVLTGFLDLLSNEVCGCSLRFLEERTMAAGVDILRTAFRNPLRHMRALPPFFLSICSALVACPPTLRILWLYFSWAKKKFFYLWILRDALMKKNGKKRGHCPLVGGGGPPQFLF